MAEDPYGRLRQGIVRAAVASVAVAWIVAFDVLGRTFGSSFVIVPFSVSIVLFLAGCFPFVMAGMIGPARFAGWCGWLASLAFVPAMATVLTMTWAWLRR